MLPEGLQELASETGSSYIWWVSKQPCQCSRAHRIGLKRKRVHLSHSSQWRIGGRRRWRLSLPQQPTLCKRKQIPFCIQCNKCRANLEFISWFFSLPPLHLYHPQSTRPAGTIENVLPPIETTKKAICHSFLATSAAEALLNHRHQHSSWVINQLKLLPLTLWSVVRSPLTRWFIVVPADFYHYQ